MKTEQDGQPAPSRSKQAQSSLNTADRVRQIFGLSRPDLLRTDEIARDYRFPSAEAARKWIHRHQVPFRQRGRVVLVDRRDIELVMRTLRKTA